MCAYSHDTYTGSDAHAYAHHQLRTHTLGHQLRLVCIPDPRAVDARVYVRCLGWSKNILPSFFLSYFLFHSVSFIFFFHIFLSSFSHLLSFLSAFFSFIFSFCLLAFSHSSRFHLCYRPCFVSSERMAKRKFTVWQRGRQR